MRRPRDLAGRGQVQKQEYETKLGLFVGPDGRRWAWCDPPPRPLQFPDDFRVRDIQFSGRTSGGQGFTIAESSPSSFSAGTEKTASILLRITCPQLIVIHRPRQEGAARVEWTLINALFDGIDGSPHPEKGPNARRVDRFSFSTGTRQWELKFLSTFDDDDRENLRLGTARQLPTATLSTMIGGVGELQDVDDEAYSISRLLSLVTGSSIGGGKRRVIENSIRPAR
jgi:hypothetical protein